MAVIEQNSETTRAPEVNLTTPNDRRQDIEGKQQQVRVLHQKIVCVVLLVFETANFACLTSDGQTRGVFDPHGMAALDLSGAGRWILCSNVNTQRNFDDEGDG